MAVGVGHQFIGFFGGGIQGNRMIHIVMDRKRHVGIGAIYRTGRGKHQVLHAMVPAAFQNIDKAHDIGIHIGLGLVRE